MRARNQSTRPLGGHRGGRFNEYDHHPLLVHETSLDHLGQRQVLIPSMLRVGDGVGIRLGNAVALQCRTGAATFAPMSAFDSRESRTPMIIRFSGLFATVALRVVWRS